MAVGLTQTELERALATKFRSGYLKNPKITVTITNLRPFFITGESAETRYICARAASMFLQQSASLAALHTEQTALQLRSSMPGRPPCATIPGELGSNLTAT